MKFYVIVAFQAQNLKSDISGSGAVEAAAQWSREERASLMVSKKATVLHVSSRLDATQVMPSPILHLISNRFHEYSLKKVCRVLLSPA